MDMKIRDTPHAMSASAIGTLRAMTMNGASILVWSEMMGETIVAVQIADWFRMENHLNHTDGRLARPGIV
jgi:hypothetical protein